MPTPQRNGQIPAKAQPFMPTVGQVYANRGGGQYLCLAQLPAAGTLYYHQTGGASDTAAVFQNILSSWTFTAKGIIQYADGTIEWAHSIDGRFEETEGQPT